MDVSIFFIFSGREGEGGVRGAGSGGGSGSLFIENPRRGAGVQEGEGPGGWEGVCDELGNFFFWGGGYA